MKDAEERNPDIPMSVSENSGMSLPMRIWRLYADGFRNMTIGRYLWAIILVKLFIIFVIFKLFFFPNLLERDYENDADRAQAVRNQLVGR